MYQCFNFYRDAQGSMVVALEPTLDSISEAVVLVDPDTNTPKLRHVSYLFTLFPCRREPMFAYGRSMKNPLGEGYESGVGLAQLRRKSLGVEDSLIASAVDYNNVLVSSGKAPFNSLRNSFDVTPENKASLLKVLAELCLCICPSLSKAEVLKFFNFCSSVIDLNNENEELDCLSSVREYAEKGKVFALAPVLRNYFLAFISCCKSIAGLSDQGVKTCENILSIANMQSSKYKILCFNDYDADLIISYLPDFCSGLANEPSDAIISLGRAFIDLGFVQSSYTKRARNKLNEVANEGE